MAREGLSFELRNVVHKVKTIKETMVKNDIPMQFMGKEHLVTIEVVPLSNTIEPHYLILFKDTTLPTGHSDEQKIDKNGSDFKNLVKTKQQVLIEKLQKELAQAREDMRSITEDQEAANEELQSANEELLSGSEELQSLNEELETSKEETQTSNEELIIVNQELYDRNEQLNLTRLYAESIVTTIREPLIILNRNLQVRSANKSFYTKFKSHAEETEGRPFFKLGNNQWDIPGLRKMLEQILPDKTSIIDFEFEHDFPAIGTRIMVLNATQILRDNMEDESILVAFEDVTEKRKIDRELKLFSDKLEKQVLERTYSLNKVNAELIYSNESLEQFAYIASHDLQEPLRKIRTFSSLLKHEFKEDLPREAQDLIDKITNSSERMSTLIKEVLDYSRILHGGELFEKVNLNNIVSDILHEFDLLIIEKKAIVNYNKLPVIEVIPPSDKTTFQQFNKQCPEIFKKRCVASCYDFITFTTTRRAD